MTATRARAPAVTGVLMLLAACGGGDAPLEVPGPEVRGGNAGVDAPVSEDVTVQDVELAFPEDGVYREGQDAALYVGITNTGTEPVTLVGVAGPDFGEAEVTPDLPLEVPADGNVYVGAEGAPTITLVDLDEGLRSSESIPVTFTFARAGDVTVEAVVAAAGQDPEADVDVADPDPDPTDA